ncbi:MAG: PAS domain S-box protein [Chloroflexota bacterium]|nr:MAG: PAS domain S-box protein [Chloroflexota bacterium]
MAQYSLKSWLKRIVGRPGFWFIFGLLLLITLIHYREAQEYPGVLARMISDLGLSRHSFERIFYLAIVVWAGFLYGWIGAFITSLIALACMFPRAVFISPTPLDATFEMSAVFIIGNVLAISFASLRKERDYRMRLEATHQELQISEQRYRQLFENAHDAIWLHDLDGNITVVNKAAEKLTGYSTEELTKMNVRSFLYDENLKLAGQIRHKLLANEPIEQPYEQRLKRKDGSEAFVQLATSLVFSNGTPAAFQHIARDITEQKRMQENLRHYLTQVTKGQEEERRRISHELHDETIQALVVLSRSLDTLASKEKLSKKHRSRLEELWQQTNGIIQGVRRLSQDLRPAALDRLGLLPALEWLASDVASYSGIEIKVNLLGKERRLSTDVELVLFRIAQESLRNAWKHSGATKAEITIDFGNSTTRITVCDNGKGFKIPEKIGNLARDGKLGLAGMQERSQLIGGKLTVQSEPGKGSRITIELPA